MPTPALQKKANVDTFVQNTTTPRLDYKSYPPSITSEVFELKQTKVIPRTTSTTVFAPRRTIPQDVARRKSLFERKGPRSDILRIIFFQCCRAHTLHNKLNHLHTCAKHLYLVLYVEHRELTEDEMLLSVLLSVSGRSAILGALESRSRPSPDRASLAWWNLPCSGAPPTPAAAAAAAAGISRLVRVRVAIVAGSERDDELGGERTAGGEDGNDKAVWLRRCRIEKARPVVHHGAVGWDGLEKDEEDTTACHSNDRILKQ